MNTMKTQHIEYFLAICDELNFTRAAEKCGVAHPTVTAAIQRMERHVGGALFLRLPLPPYVQLTALALLIRLASRTATFVGSSQVSRPDERTRWD